MKITIAQRLDAIKETIIKQIIDGASHKQLAHLHNCDIKDIHDFKQRHKKETEEAVQLASWQHLQKADDLADEIDDDATTGRIARNKEKIKIELYKAKIKNRAVFDDNFKNRGVDKEGNIVVIPSEEVLRLQQQSLLPPKIILHADTIKTEDDYLRLKKMLVDFEKEKQAYEQHINQVIIDDI